MQQNQEDQVRRERKKHDFAKKHQRHLRQDNGAKACKDMRILRPLNVSVGGTDEERMFFHRYHMAAETELVFGGANSRANFWKRLLPQMAHSNDAVKHGLIALSAANQLMKISHPQRSSMIEKHVFEGSEHFAISQYNKSIHHLKQHTALLTFENFEITLICCLVFICFEAARGNTDDTRVHLSKGLEMIDKLLSNTFFLYCTLSDGDARNISLEKTAITHGFLPSRLSKTEWRNLLHFFADLELGLALYDGKTTPSISLRVLKLDEYFSLDVPEFRTVDEVSNEFSHWYYHLFARLHQTGPYRGNVEWWAGSEQQRLHNRLLSWGRNLLQRVDEFMNGPWAPNTERWIDVCSIMMDKAQCRALLQLVEWMPHQHSRRNVFEEYETLQRKNVEDWEDIVRYIGHPDRMPDLTINFNGVLAMLHGAMFQSSVASIRRRARDIVAFFSGKHAQLFHATTMLRLFDSNGVGDPGRLSPALDVFLDEPVGLSINEKIEDAEIEPAEKALSKSSALLCKGVGDDS